MRTFILAIDQGTTSTRAMIFDTALDMVAAAQREFRQLYPGPGLVEHDPEEIWSSTVATVREAMGQVGADAREIAAALTCSSSLRRYAPVPREGENIQLRRMSAGSTNRLRERCSTRSRRLRP